jgi:NUDIX domain
MATGPANDAIGRARFISDSDRRRRVTERMPAALSAGVAAAFRGPSTVGDRAAERERSAEVVAHTVGEFRIREGPGPVEDRAEEAACRCRQYDVENLGVVQTVVPQHLDVASRDVGRRARRLRGERDDGALLVVERVRHVADRQPRDVVLRDELLYQRDPDAWQAYLAEGNRTHPRKRVSADVLFRDESGQILLVDPRYKPDWDLPGGMAEANEAPLDAADRA